MSGWKKTYDLFVGNITQDISEGDVIEAFSGFEGYEGTVYKEGSRGDGSKIAFVKFNTEEAADAVLTGASSFMIKDCSPLMRRANKKTQDGGKPEQRKGFTNKSAKTFDGFASFKSDSSSSTDPGEGPSSYTPAQKQQQKAENKSKTSLEPLRSEQVIMTHVEGPCMFWGQVFEPNKQQELSSITDSLTVVCPSSPVVSGQPDIGSKVYACKFSEDGLWYRCKALKHIDSNKSQIQYIDYGNSEVVENNSIHELPGNLSSPRGMAVKYVLFGLTPLFTDHNSVGFEQGIIKLRELTAGKMLDAQVYPGARFVTPVIISSEDQDINQEVLNAGFGERRLGANKRVNKPTNRVQQSWNEQQQQSTQEEQSLPVLPPNQFTQPPPPLPWAGGMGKSPNSNAALPPTTMPVSNMESTFVAIPPPLPGKSEGFGVTREPVRVSDAMGGSIGTWEEHVASPPPPAINTSPQMVQFPQHTRPQTGSGDTNEHIKAQLAQQLEAIAHFQQQVEHIQRQYAMLESRAQGLERERNDSLVTNAKLKGSIMELQRDNDEKQKNFLSTLQKMDAMNNRVREVEEYVKRVRQLRRQFPTDGNVRDNIDYALGLLVDNPDAMALDQFSSLDAVKQAHKAYTEMQETVGKTSKAALDAVIAERDGARRQLHDNIAAFLQEVDSRPLDRRSFELREALTGLRQSHGAFLQPEMKATLPLEEVMAMYKPWKDKKDIEFQDVRTETNTCHNEVNTALMQNQQLLSLDPSLCDSAPVGGPLNLDSILLRFMYRLQQEISVTDLEKSADATFVTMKLKSIIHTIAKEMADIEQIQSLRHSYEQTQSELAEWLDKKPNTEPLKQVRQNIKMLKSKLRHKLADKQDAEESDDSELNLEEIINEISAIRQLLQAEFTEEDKLSLQLAQQSMQHFPELAVQFPESGLDLVAEHGGLVKKGRSLDHYDIQPFTSEDNTSVRLTTFNEKPVMLKEYIIDENLGIPRQEFMERLLAYHRVKSDHIIPVEAVFFLQNQRHAHVQVPYYGSSLAQCLQENPQYLSDKSMSDILLGVMKGLEALHQNNLVHGAVNPTNVFVKEDGTGILAEFDFTKSLKQRSEKPYTSENGLRFSSPETSIHGEISKASDVFNLGLLALWLVFPAHHITLQTSGAPVVPGTSEFPAALRCLLDACPEKRPTIQQLLCLPYFCPEEEEEEEEEEEGVLDGNTPSSTPSQPEAPVTLQLRSKSPTGATPKDRSSPDTVRKGILKTSPPLQPLIAPNFVPIQQQSPPPTEDTPPRAPTPPTAEEVVGDVLEEDVMAEVNARIEAHIAESGETNDVDAELVQLRDGVVQQLTLSDSGEALVEGEEETTTAEEKEEGEGDKVEKEKEEVILDPLNDAGDEEEEEDDDDDDDDDGIPDLDPIEQD